MIMIFYMGIFENNVLKFKLNFGKICNNILSWKMKHILRRLLYSY